HTRLLTAEIILIIASVFIFRSGWHLLDKWAFFNEIPTLTITLILGFLIAIPTWRYIFNQQDRHHH
ncbi:MAG: hypothetical protein AAB943_00365, partial [Patescibacteria group bacterium]